MAEIFMFDDADDLFNYVDTLHERELRAYEDLPKFLLDGLQTGHFYVTESYGILIFGEIVDPRFEEGYEPQSDQPHLRLVRAYSEACPEGELCSVWVTGLWPISKEHFNEAQNNEWRIPRKVALAWFAVRAQNLKAVCDE